MFILGGIQTKCTFYSFWIWHLRSESFSNRRNILNEAISHLILRSALFFVLGSNAASTSITWSCMFLYEKLKNYSIQSFKECLLSQIYAKIPSHT